MNTHPFDAEVVLSRIEVGEYRGKTSAHYANMVGPFGGFVSAIFMKAVLSDDRQTGTPVAVTVNFCGSIADGDFTIQYKLQRGGKYTQHWSLELTQENSVRATASIVCGTRGDVFEHQEARMPDVPPPEACELLPKGALLKWIDAFDLRFAKGYPSFVGKAFDEVKESQSIVWMRDNPPRPLDYLSLACLCDTFFLRPLQMRGTFPLMGTVSLTSHFHATPQELKSVGEDFVLGMVYCKRMNGQFNDQQMEVWSKDGTLLASGGQIAWYKD